jgi:hypothetical protein
MQRLGKKGAMCIVGMCCRSCWIAANLQRRGPYLNEGSNDSSFCFVHLHL